MMQIGPETPVEALVEQHPAAIRFLGERGIVCVVCGEPFWGTLGTLLDQKGVTDRESIFEALRAVIAGELNPAK